jgi:tetratricopeptide (TPR) repeat protein
MSIGIDPQTLTSWAIALLGMSILLLVVRWLRQEPKQSFFNQANKHYKKLRYLLDRPKEFQPEALKVIQFCQLSIQARANDGDAHVLLASAYYMLANCFKDTAIYNYCMPRAVAVITKWQHGSMYTKNRSSGQYILKGILEDVEMIASLNNSLVESITSSSKELYSNAIDPSGFEELRRFAESEHILTTALSLHEKSMHREAITLYSQVLSQDPSNSRALFGRGMVFNDEGFYPFALADIEDAIRLSPNCHYIGGRALIHTLMENYIEALADFNRAIELCTDFVSAYAQRGMVQWHLGKKKEAISDFTYYLSHVPPDQANIGTANVIQGLLKLDRLSENIASVVKPLEQLRDEGVLTQDAYDAMVKLAINKLLSFS